MNENRFHRSIFGREDILKPLEGVGIVLVESDFVQKAFIAGSHLLKYAKSYACKFCRN